MLGVGPSEMVLVAIIALVVIGPEKFPEVAKIVLRTFRDVRGYMDDVKGELRRELQPLKKEIDQVSRQNPEDLIEAITGESIKDDKPSDYDKKNDPYGYVAQEGPAAQEKTAAQGAAQTADAEQKPAESSSSSTNEWDEFADQKANTGVSGDTAASSDTEAETVAQAAATDSQPSEPAKGASIERLDG